MATLLPRGLRSVSDAHHDDGEWHRQSGHASEERRGPDESHGSRVDPQPEAVGGHRAVDVGEQQAEGATVQAADESETNGCCMQATAANRAADYHYVQGYRRPLRTAYRLPLRIGYHCEQGYSQQTTAANRLPLYRSYHCTQATTAYRIPLRRELQAATV